MPERKTPPSSPKPAARTAKKPAASSATARKRPSRPKTPPKPRDLSNVARVRADLAGMGPEIENSGLAGAALTLARDLDNRKNSATSHAMCAKALLDVMAQLRDLAPAKKQNDGIDKIRAKHDRRRSRLRAVQ